MSTRKLTSYRAAFLIIGFLTYLSVHPVFAAISLDGGGGIGVLSQCASFAMQALPSAVPKGIPTAVTFSWTQRRPGFIDGGGTGTAEDITNLQTGAVVYSSPIYVNPVTVTITITASTVFELNVYTTSNCETTPIGVLVAATNPVCGNGIKETGEDCDAGPLNGACPAICSTSCKINTCSGQFDQGSGTIFVSSTNPGPYSIPILVTGKDSATGIITSTSSLMVNLTVAPSAGPVGTINVINKNFQVQTMLVNASWNLSGPPGGACQGAFCTGTQATYASQPLGPYVILPGTAAGFAFHSIERQTIAVRPNGVLDGIFSYAKNFLISVAQAFSYPVSNPPNQPLTASLSTNVANFVILWDPIAQLGVAPAAVPVTNTSPNGIITISNPGSPGSVLNWSASAPSYGAGASGWLTVPSSGSVAAGASQNITAAATTGGIPPGACRAASPCTATVTFTGTYLADNPPIQKVALAPNGIDNYVTATITLTMSGGPVKVKINSPTPVAQGVPAQVTCTGGSGSYQWSSTGPATFNSTSGSTVQVTYSSPGTYHLTCTDPGGGGSDTKSIVITADCTIVASPALVVPPQSSKLNWSCEDKTATSCTINGTTVCGTVESCSDGGSLPVAPQVNTTYILSCTPNNGIPGSTMPAASATVSVRGPGVHETNP